MSTDKQLWVQKQNQINVKFNLWQRQISNLWGKPMVQSEKCYWDNWVTSQDLGQGESPYNLHHNNR